MTYPAQPPSLPGYPPAPGGVPAAYMPPNPAAAAPQGYPGPAVPAPAAAPAAPQQPQIPPGWEMGPTGLRPAAPQGFRYNAAGQLEPAAAAPPPQAPPPGYPPQGYAAPPPPQGYAPPAPQGYGPPPAPQGYGPPPAAMNHGAMNPAGAPNPFFGVKLPGERLPDPPVGDHIFDCDKIRLTDDRTGLIVALHTAWSAVQCPPDCSTYVNLFAYRSREYSGELIKLVLSCVGCKSYEELEASGPQAKDRFVALANRVVNGEEGALLGCRIAARGYMKTAGEKSAHKGEQFLKLAISPYRPNP